MTPPVDPRVERTRAVVHDAAACLLASEGLDGFTMEALAERSGVARSTIYRHWPDRSDLLAEAFDAVAPDLPDDDGDHVVDRLVRRAWAIADGLVHERWGQLLPVIVAAAQHDKVVRTALDRLNVDRRTHTRDVVLAAVERGEIAAPDDLDLVLDAFIGPFFFRLLVTGEPIDDAFVRFQVERLLRDVGLADEDLTSRTDRAR